MKKIILSMLIIALIFSIVGCSKNDLEAYKEASKKTNGIKKGQTSFDLNIENQFNTRGLTEEEIKKLSYFKKIELKIDLKFDEEQDKLISRNYYNFSGMGFDSTLYVDNEKVFIKMPMLGKYLVLEDEIVNSQLEDKEYQHILKDTFNKINNSWLNVLEKDDVFLGENTVMSTPDGEVKATRFTIKLTNEQLKELINNTVNVLAEDVSFNNILREIIITKGEEVNTKEIYKRVKESLNKSTINEFEYETYVDIDGYIIQEDIRVIVEYENSTDGSINKQIIDIKAKNWNIEKEQEFNFPEIDEENILEMKNMGEGLPFIFDDMFKDGDREE